MNERLSFGVVLLNLNDHESTIRALESVIESFSETEHAYNLVVIDNGSEYPIVQKLKGAIAKLQNGKVSFIGNKTNLGYGAAMNLGVKCLDEKQPWDYYWFLNNDIVMDLDCVSRIADYIQIHQQAKIIGPTVYGEEGAIQYSGGCLYNSWLGIDRPYIEKNEANRTHSDVNNFDYIYGAAPLVSAKFFHDAGRFAKVYFLYFEELHLASLCKNQELRWCKPAKIYHVGGATQKNDARVKYFCTYHAALSCFRFTFAHYPYKLPSVVLTRFLGKAVHALARKEPLLIKAVSLAFMDFVANKSRKSISEF